MLRREFAASLAGRMREVRAALSEKGAALDRARTIVHQLRGTGASFDLPDVSETAARAEAALIRYTRGKDESVWPEIEAACAALEAACAVAAR